MIEQGQRIVPVHLCPGESVIASAGRGRRFGRRFGRLRLFLLGGEAGLPGYGKSKARQQQGRLEAALGMMITAALASLAPDYLILGPGLNFIGEAITNDFSVPLSYMAGLIVLKIAATSFTLRVGNAGGVTLLLDDLQLPPLGRSGQVVTLRLP